MALGRYAETPSAWSLRVERSVAVGFVGPRRISIGAAAWARAEVEGELGRQTADATGRRLLVPLANGLERDLASFALDSHLELEAVVPSQNFAASLADAERPTFEALVARASDNTTLTYAEPSEAALEGAARYIMHSADVVVAVLDSDASVREDRGASIIEVAHRARRRLIVIDPVTKTTITHAA